MRPTLMLQFANSNAVRVLVCTGILWIFSFAVCKQLLWREPHSAFFREEGVYDLGYSAGRQAEALAYISHVAEQALPQRPARQPIICAAWTTFKREGRSYLQEAIGSMLEGLSEGERDAIDLRLLFTHVEPQQHQDWNRTWLNVFEHWSGYNVSKEELDRVRDLEARRDFYNKGVYDYVYMLEQCLTDSTAPYIAVFEDDIIFADGWFVKTVRALTRLRNKSEEWFYLRLFYTETSLGWDADLDFWYRNMPLTFALIMSFATGFLLALRRLDHRARQALDLVTIAAVCLVTVPAFLALFFMLGKYTVRPLHGVELMNRYGCCTQALVFPRAKVRGLIDYLRERKSGQTDALIEEYADRSLGQRYALAPQVVQHVGLVSSRDNLAVNTRSTWAFWFETQNAARLKQEHDAVDWDLVLKGYKDSHGFL